MRQRLLLYLLLFSFPVFLFSCEDKDKTEDMRNAIVGSWQLSSVQIDGTNADLTAYPNTVQFKANYIFESKNSADSETVRGGWSYEGNMLNISVYLPAAFYIVKVDSQNLILKRLDFNSSGLLIETILNYRKL